MSRLEALLLFQIKKFLFKKKEFLSNIKKTNKEKERERIKR